MNEWPDDLMLEIMKQRQLELRELYSNHILAEISMLRRKLLKNSASFGEENQERLSRLNESYKDMGEGKYNDEEIEKFFKIRNPSSIDNKNITQKSRSNLSFSEIVRELESQVGSTYYGSQADPYTRYSNFTPTTKSAPKSPEFPYPTNLPPNYKNIKWPPVYNNYTASRILPENEENNGNIKSSPDIKSKMHEHIKSEELDQRIRMESGSGEANVLQPMETSKILGIVDNVKKTWSERENNINGNSIKNFLEKIESRYFPGPTKEEPKNLPPAPLLLFGPKNSPKASQVDSRVKVNTICSPKKYPVKTSQPGPSHSPNSPMCVEYSLKPQMRLYTYNNPFCVTAHNLYSINNNREHRYSPPVIFTKNVPLVLSPGQTPRPNPTSPYDVYPCRVISPLVLSPGQTPRPNPTSPQIQLALNNFRFH
jgi:hypothetical protein